MLRRTLTAPLQFVSPSDEAVDRSSADFDEDKYLETFDPRYLPLKPGMAPAVFTGVRFSRRQREDVDARESPFNSVHARTQACRIGLTAVSGLDIATDDGPPRPFVLERKDDLVTDKSLDELGADLVQELGAAFRRYARASTKSA